MIRNIQHFGERTLVYAKDLGETSIVGVDPMDVINLDDTPTLFSLYYLNHLL